MGGAFLTLCRSSDVVTRYAGDEFVMILPETTQEQAVVMMRRMLAELARRPLVFEERTIAVTAGYGVASSEA